MKVARFERCTFLLASPGRALGRIQAKLDSEPHAPILRFLPADVEIAEDLACEQRVEQLAPDRLDGLLIRGADASPRRSRPQHSDLQCLQAILELQASESQPERSVRFARGRRRHDGVLSPGRGPDLDLEVQVIDRHLAHRQGARIGPMREGDGSAIVVRSVNVATSSRKTRRRTTPNRIYPWLGIPPFGYGVNVPTSC